MKKFEEAKLEMIELGNDIIVTSSFEFQPQEEACDAYDPDCLDE